MAVNDNGSFSLPTMCVGHKLQVLYCGDAGFDALPLVDRRHEGTDVIPRPDSIYFFGVVFHRTGRPFRLSAHAKELPSSEHGQSFVRKQLKTCSPGFLVDYGKVQCIILTYTAVQYIVHCCYTYTTIQKYSSSTVVHWCCILRGLGSFQRTKVHASVQAVFDKFGRRKARPLGRAVESRL